MPCPILSHMGSTRQEHLLHYQAYQGNSRSFAACFVSQLHCLITDGPQGTQNCSRRSRKVKALSFVITWLDNSSLTRDIVLSTLTGDRVSWTGVGKTGKQNKEDAFQTHRIKFAIEEKSWANFCARHSLSLTLR